MKSLMKDRLVQVLLSSYVLALWFPQQNTWDLHYFNNRDWYIIRPPLRKKYYKHRFNQYRFSEAEHNKQSLLLDMRIGTRQR
ncbi:hypothetical protein DFJ43DRAFT_1074695 [Lentinula guzmanii]|uniref:Uncharacterized protein n=1 Tax=Lentinula guzmanii TaxID=2804957 RepID=A0AA38JCC8_9AGAR|nr:hypothetical protein DFJ43DRAFT_1074695 [Lentinula guzmanii]